MWRFRVIKQNYNRKERHCVSKSAREDGEGEKKDLGKICVKTEPGH